MPRVLCARAGLQQTCSQGHRTHQPRARLQERRKPARAKETWTWTCSSAGAWYRQRGLGLLLGLWPGEGQEQLGGWRGYLRESAR